MAEVVTYSAASQLNLLAHRQQDFAVERSPVQDTNAATEAQQASAIEKAARNAAANSAGQDQAFERRQQQKQQEAQPQAANPGPSKPRVELKRIDLGLSASEVVGTPDVLQRFDDNGDGRVDMLESQQVLLSRNNSVTTFAGLAASPARIETKSFAPEQPVDASPRPAPPVANPDQHVTAKKFFVSPGQPGGEDAGVAVSKKFFGAAETASLGAPTDSADAPRKFYGQGAEVVIGQFAAAHDATPKYYVKGEDARSPGAISEDGTGEVKYYDKVAQSDSGRTFGDSTSGESSYYEKAQQAAGSLSGGTGAPEQKKFVHAELTVYSETAQITGEGAPRTVPAGSTVITA
ncbi:MAG: hypothetical protein RLN70_13675 [Rhodospirillaceae bacterium]